MKILKNIFGRYTKIATSEVADEAGRLLSDSVIVESGSNANGRWIKYADGTMECWAVLWTYGHLTTPSGSIFRTFSNTWTFPQPFVDVPAVFRDTVTGGDYIWAISGNNIENTANRLLLATFAAMSPVSRSNGVQVSLRAVGRWK